MEVEESGREKATDTGASEAALEREIEHYKELLLEHDRSLSHRLSKGEKTSLEDKRARSRIVRHLNRTRRQLYRLKKGTVPQPTKSITVRVTQDDYARLQTFAELEGLSLSAYIRKQLLPDK